MAVMVDTELVDESEAQPRLAAPAPPPVGGWPNWLRRTVIAVVLLAALGSAVWLVASSNGGNTNAIDTKVVLSLSPNDGSQALRQTAVGADLAVGYDGRLTINGIEIPEEQMVGARDPATVDPKDLLKNGIRANNRNTVYFKPGPGKVIESFEQGSVDIVLRYFKDGEASRGGTVRWSIRVI
jgi:hypothetical protein